MQVVRKRTLPLTPAVALIGIPSCVPGPSFYVNGMSGQNKGFGVSQVPDAATLREWAGVWQEQGPLSGWTPATSVIIKWADSKVFWYNASGMDGYDISYNQGTLKRLTRGKLQRAKTNLRRLWRLFLIFVRRTYPVEDSNAFRKHLRAFLRKAKPHGFDLTMFTGDAL